MSSSIPVRVTVAITLVMSVACVPPAAREQLAEEPAEGLAPTFAATTPGAEPTSSGPQASTPARVPPTTPVPAPDSTPDATPDRSSVETSGPSPEPVLRQAAVLDPAGDVEDPLLVDSPDYADLISASIEVVDAVVTLSVGFAGRTPERSDDDHTMNVASFYDVDGDGSIDYEVWGNLSSTGWGTSWFDNREGQALFGADDEVEVSVTPEELVLQFPHRYVGGSGSFRWALAAEWGTYEALATNQMTSDRAPDEGRPANFPN